MKHCVFLAVSTSGYNGLGCFMGLATRVKQCATLWGKKSAALPYRSAVAVVQTVGWLGCMSGPALYATDGSLTTAMKGRFR